MASAIGCESSSTRALSMAALSKTNLSPALRRREPLPSRYLEACVTHIRETYTGAASSEDTVAASKNTIELIS